MPSKFDKRDIQDIVELTSMQEGMLFHYLREPRGEFYFEQLSLEISGEIDTACFEKAWNFVISTNDMLRAAFRWEKVQNPVQIILKEHKLQPQYYDFSHKHPHDAKKLLADLEKQDRNRQFDLRTVPFRVTLVKVEEKKYRLIISHHHILYDGWSNGIILEEFFSAYHAVTRGKMPRKTGKPAFKEYVKILRHQGQEVQEKFWKEYLKDLEPLTELSVKRIKNRRGHTGSGKVMVSLPGSTKEQLEKLTLQHRITPAALFYCAWGSLLQRYNNSADTVFGTTVSGRTAKIQGIEKMVGLFINTIPLRIKAYPHETILSLLYRIDDQLKARQEVEHTSLLKIKEYGGIENQGELFDTIVVIENYPLGSRLKMQKDPFSISSFSMQETTHYDLTLGIALFDEIELTFTYQPEKFDQDAIRRLTNHFKKIVREILTYADKAVSSLEMITGAEKKELLHDFNGTNMEYPPGKTTHQLFEEQVERTPGSTALIFQDQQLSYRHLNEKANQLVLQLIAKGIRTTAIVAIVAERSMETIIGLLGILKAGGAYLPIDSNYPGERKQYMLKESGARILVSGVDEGIEIIDLHRIEFKGNFLTQPTQHTHLTQPNLAYVIYTSGSTGKPKGVLVEHHSVVNLALSQKHYFNIDENDRILQFSSLCFDASVEQIFIAFFSGAVLVLVDRNTLLDSRKFEEFISSRSISHLHAVPSFLSNIKVRDTFKLKRVIAGGDVCPVALAKKWSKYCDFYNEYGPTETTVTSIEMMVRTGDVDETSVQLPIGRPINNTAVYIFDKWMKLVPKGAAGELYIGGKGVTRGYLNNPELTAEKFLSSFYRSYKSYMTYIPKKIYKTGDLARWLSMGAIEFLGRNDHQVKVRGFRIELGEIENQLSNHNDIKETVVTAMEDETGDNYLCAYIVPGQDSSISIPALREYLSGFLPGYMIPAYFIMMEKLPLTPTGKIDKKALPEPHPEMISKDDAPRDKLEETLAEIWSQILGIEKNRIGIDADFFRLGGHSLKAVRLLGHIHKAFNISVPLKVIFDSPTIRGMANYLGKSMESPFTGIPPAEKTGYYPMSSSQERLFFLYQMDRSATAYNMTGVMLVQGNIETKKWETIFKNLITRHESLRTSFLMVKDKPVQRVYEDFDFKIEQVKVEEKEGKLTTNTIGGFIRPIDLASPPLLRVGLLELRHTPSAPGSHPSQEGESILIVDMHHIISDGVSINLLMKEFQALYAGMKLPALRIQYKDYARWQKSKEIRERIKNQQEYWVNVFSDEIPVLDLAADFTRPMIRDSAGGTTAFELETGAAASLKTLAVEHRATLFMVLLSGVNILLSKLSSQEDIVIGTPGASRQHTDLQPIIGMFVNTLALRNYPVGAKSFSEFLSEVKVNTIAAFENQDYPFEELIEQLDIERDTGRNPLFDTMFAMQNMEIERIEISQLRLTPYPYQRRAAKFDLALTCEEVEQKLLFTLEYSTALFKEETVKRFISYFKRIISTIIDNPDNKIAGIEIISTREKNQLLYDFNDTKAAYPKHKTIHRLFQEQVERIPDHIVAAEPLGKEYRSYMTHTTYISYRELNQKSNQLARALRKLSISNDAVVGLLMEPCVSMMIGIMGILKAGAAYLPIDPNSPPGRIEFIINDTAIPVLLCHNSPRPTGFKGKLLDLHQSSLFSGPSSNPSYMTRPKDLAYVIYTSGSTGRPKGAAVEHSQLVNFVYHMYNRYEGEVDSRDRCLGLTNIMFDVSVWEFFLPLVFGARLVILPQQERFDVLALAEAILQEGITLIYLPPGLLKPIGEELAKQRSRLKLNKMLVGVEPIRDQVLEDYMRLNPRMRIINGYGPTETTICATSFNYSSRPPTGEIVPIGIPLSNNQVVLLDPGDRLVPRGAPGEICISGDGVSRGYLNNPQLTAEKYPPHPYFKGKRMYRSGDLARWLPQGNIRFMGRRDQQLKIRGYRIELGEIESRLLKHENIKQALAAVNGDEPSGKYLCAYIVLKEPFDISVLREFLSGDLPDYMIPSYFVKLDKIPLTPNGKVDRKALPVPQIQPGENYTAPGDKIEKKLAEIWSEVLGIEIKKIGIDENFFHLGGHSLKATLLTTKIQKEMNVTVPLTEIFKTSHIRGLAAYIKKSAAKKYIPIEPVEKKDYYPLSSAQKRLFILQQMDKQGIVYNIPSFWKLEGSIDTERVKKTFLKLIQRHESLRTSFHIMENEPVQRIHDEVSFEIEYYDINSFIRSFDLSQPPLLRVGVTKLLHTPAALRGHPSQEENSEDNYILMIDMHHIIADGASIQVLIKDFTSLYEGRNLPLPALQYKEFSVWQSSGQQKASIKKQEQYWLQEFKNELPVLDLPVDFTRPLVQDFSGSALTFETSPGETHALKSLAHEQNITMFMALLSLYTIFLSKLGRQEDIVVGTPIAGRRQPGLQPLMGMFVNTLALRNYPVGEKRFNDFLKEVKQNTLTAFENQDYPFEELVEQIDIKRDTGRNPLFDVMFAVQNLEMETKKIEIGDLSLTPYRYQWRVSRVDLAFICQESKQNLFFTIEYSTKLFKKETIKRFINCFKKIISSIVETPGSKISRIEIITAEEKKQILYDFNKTKPQYPQDKTIHGLFAAQAEQTPDNIAVAAPSGEKYRSYMTYMTYISYRELNRKSHRLTGVLREKGLRPDSIVAIKIERSIEMIIAILGILKAGAAYLPIDPDSPEERIKYMLNDSKVNILIKKSNDIGNFTLEKNIDAISIDEVINKISPKDTSSHLHLSPAPATSLAYIIYTSGSTGRPKGVPISHMNFSPLVHWGYDILGIGSGERVVQNLSYFFDWSVWEIFMGLTTGSILLMVPAEVIMNPRQYIDFMEYHQVTVLHITPTHFHALVKEGGKLHTLKYLAIGAEKLSLDLLRQSCEAVNKDCRVFNMYGPTEATIMSAVLEAPRQGEGAFDAYPTLTSVPIGLPIANLQLLVVDRYFNLCPVLVPGELLIAGDGLSRGYLNNPELTAEKFDRDFWDSQDYHDEKNQKFLRGGPGGAVFSKRVPPGRRRQKIYKTGDLARWLPDGNIEFLGRIDHQLKIRGFRIELGEIENQLLSHGQIKAAAVLARAGKDEDKYLCAYFVANENLSSTELREFLSGKLPAYMIPAYFIPLKEIPLTPNGKIDHQALPEPEIVKDIQILAPRNRIEEKLTQLWSEVLGIEKKFVSIDSDFFELGGHSLKATLLLSKIHQAFQVDIPLTEIFTSSTVKELAACIKNSAKARYTPIEPAEKKEYYRASSAQERLYVLQQMDTAGIAYNIPSVFMLEGTAEINKLQEASRKLIHRHESLRTSFHMLGEKTIQKIHPHLEFSIRYYNLSAQDKKVTALINHFIRPFDLSKAPLLRVGLLELPHTPSAPRSHPSQEGKSILIVDMHHIISDGTSMTILIKDFAALYQGKNLPAPLLQYKDFSQWQTGDEQKTFIKNQEQYWLKKFAAETPVLILPTDFTRPVIQRFTGSTIKFAINQKQIDILKLLAHEHDVTLFMILLSLYTIFLAKLSGQEDIVVGTPMAGRRHASLEQVIGMFVNTLPLRNYPSGEKKFKEFLREVKENTLTAFENQDYPFEKLIDQLEVERDTGRTPLLDTMFILQNLDFPGLEVPGLKIKSYQYERTTSKFDLTLECIEQKDGLSCIVEYSTQLFKEETIRRFTRYLQRIISGAAANPGIKISGIEMLPEEEIRQLVFDFNDTAEGFPTGKTIHQLFEERVERIPDHAALVFKDKMLTFRHFDEKANQLANYLRQEKGIVSGDRIAVLQERSIDLPVTLMGVLKSGGAYVPLDPALPLDRLRKMFNDAAISTAVTHQRFRQELTPLLKTGKTLQSLVYTDDPGSGIDKYPLQRPGITGAANPAYVMYTSGSSGIPKGVLVEHQTIVNTLIWRKNFYGYRPGNVSLQIPPYFFDSSVTDIFTPLLGGARLVLVTENERVDFTLLKQVIPAADVSHFIAVPAFYYVLLEEIAADLKGVKMICCAGEHFPDELIKKHFEKLPHVRIVNEYGPTENSVNTTAYELNPDSPRALIGKPISNVNVYILDRYRCLSPIGVTGEMGLAGSSLSRGYLNSPEMTAEKFVFRFYRSYKTYKSYIPKRFYLTGDLGRWLESGNLEFLGRADNQVKIRGIRIEIEEIENCLMKHDLVKEAVVIVGRKKSGAKFLCAYFTASANLEIPTLRVYLEQQLPNYMIPSYFMQLEKIPLAPTGKIDRKHLPEPELNPTRVYAAPGSDKEKIIANTWKQVLELESIGIDDNFFEIGGNSLDTVKISHRLKEEIGIDVPVVMMFRYPTIRSLAAYLHQDTDDFSFKKQEIFAAIEKGKNKPKPNLQKRKEKAGMKTGREIAVIGMAGRFPGARNIAEFWENLKNGVESICFFTVEELEKAGEDPDLLQNPDYVKAKAVLSDIEYFDNHFFGYTPGEAEVMDPQMRILHETVWEALEDAGYDPSYPGRIGLYAGGAGSIYWESLVSLSSWGETVDPYTRSSLTNKDFLSVRISYKLGLKGPAFMINTTCSTSLAAIHLAVQGLLSGECELAAAGGVKVALPGTGGYLYQKGMIMSPDGHCRAFTANANGTVSGEGAGIVILKSLAEAEADGDYIYAVVKGTAVNNDGLRKPGFQAPSVEGQAEVISAAMYSAQVEPRSIGYLETHGTGTELGDPVEIEALKLAFSEDIAENKQNYCAIGSIKTNIGHLDTAAGAAGFIKAVLSLQHRLIPPSLHFENPNPKIAFENSAFYVNTVLREWRPDEYPRRAGVSSFGIGGTNAHIILEEAPQPVIGHWSSVIGEEKKEREHQLILLSAGTETALDKTTENLVNHLKENPASLADTAYTLQVGRKLFACRKMLVGSTVDEITTQITSPSSPGVRTLFSSQNAPPVVFMFPGQGSQYVNMGLDLYRAEPLFRQEMDGCFEILKPLMGYDIKEILYPSAVSNRSNKSYMSDITQTEIAQPLIFALEYALARLLMDWGIQPYAMMGHSIGEYVAACLSGVFSLENALAIVTLRGRLMQKLPTGSMLSVSLSEQELTPLLIEGVSVAAVNSPGLCAVSGSRQAIAAFSRSLEQAGHRYRRLHTSHAFHSAMMDPMLEEFEKQVNHYRLNKPRIPYISNVTGTWAEINDVRSAAYWARHLRQTVRFGDGIGELCQKNNTVFLEVGPGKSLATFARQNPARDEEQAVLELLRHPHHQEEDRRFLLDKIGQMWLHGVKINWPAFHGGARRHRIPLPTYPFERLHFPIIGSPLKMLRDNRGWETRLEKRKKIADWFYVPTWETSDLSQLPPTHTREVYNWLVFSTGPQTGNDLVTALQNQGHDVIIVTPGEGFSTAGPGEFIINPDREEDYEKVFARLQAIQKIPGRILHLWNISDIDKNGGSGQKIKKTGSDPDSGYYSLLAIARAVGKLKITDKIAMAVISDHLQDVWGVEEPEPGKAVLLGPVKVIPREFSNLRCCSIDIASIDPVFLVSQLLEEFSLDLPDAEVAYRGKRRWVRRAKPLPFEKVEEKQALPLKEQGVYLITGGLGGIGLTLAEYLAGNYQARLILVGRSSFPDRQHWEEQLAVYGENSPLGIKIRKLLEMEHRGGQVLVVKADCADEQQMLTGVAWARQQFGKIDGVIHAAGIADAQRGFIQQRTKQMSEAVMAAKVKGTLVLDTILKGENPDFFMLCSSLSSVLVPPGQVAYSAANAFLDAFARYKTFKQGTFCVSVNWDSWQEVGMAVAALEKTAANQLNAKEKQEISHGLLPREGIEAFQRILSRRASRVIISTRDLPALLAAAKKLEKGESEAAPPAGIHPDNLRARPRLGKTYTAPANPVEKEIVGIWENFLGITPVGIHDDFFELGGDSLKAMSLLAILHKNMNIEVPLAEFFNMPFVSHLAKYSLHSKGSKFSDIKPVELKEYYLLSSAQERLHILYHLDDPGTGYNMPSLLETASPIDKEKYEHAFQQLIRRHESLRTSFPIINGKPVQKVHTDAVFEIEYLSAKETAGEERGEILTALMRPFDLERPPLLRVCIVERPISDLIFIDMHHIVADGLSLAILTEEFKLLIADKSEDLPLLRLQYKDYSQWQNSPTQRALVKGQESYWLKMFSDDIPVLELPTDLPRPFMQSFVGCTVEFKLTPGESRTLKTLAKETGATLYMSVLAVFNILLAKLSGQEDIIVGTPVSGRRHADMQSIIGMFVNTLAIRNQPCKEKSFKQFLQEVKTRTIEAYENQEHPFEELVDKLEVRRDPGRNPLFDVVLNLLDQQEGWQGTRELEKQDSNHYKHDKGTSKFDLTLTAVDLGRELYCSFEYCRQLFEPVTIERFIAYFKKILTRLSQDSDQKISQLEIITEPEKQQILHEFNNTDTNYPRDKTIHELFAARAEQTPDNIALAAPAERKNRTYMTYMTYISYRQLNQRSNQLAHLLLQKGSKPDTPVGIMLPRSEQMIIGILGILKAGGAYLPIDPDNPQKRIDYLLEDSNAQTILTNREMAILPSSRPYQPPVPASSLAYIIYTSGSTGKPKGVMVEHRSLVNLCTWHNAYFRVSERDHATQYANIGFDASVWEIFPSLVKGASLHIIAEEIKLDLQWLNTYYEKNDITIGFLPTPVCQQFMEYDNRSLRMLLTGGDKLRIFRPQNYTLYNNYGPTENTVVAAAFPVDKEYHNIPIGKPVYNNRIYILKPGSLTLQPLGAAGELCIGGDSLARGYLNRPELTAERFLFPLYKSDKSYMSYIPGKLYRTGDLARWLLDGNIQFLGRIDYQVKIRGYRIELGEIENNIMTYPGIKEAVVITSNDKGRQYLCAYFVTDHIPGTGIPLEPELKEYLEGRLPGYMIPDFFVKLEQVPLNPNGKVEVKMLPQPLADSRADDTYEPPQTDIQQIIAETWQEVLARERVGIKENFFDLGGNSLDLVTVRNKLKEKLAIDIPVVNLFAYPTISALEQHLKQGRGKEPLQEEPRDHFSLIDDGKNLMQQTLMKLDHGD